MCRHRGGVNAKAAISWLYSQLPNPDIVFVTGCSAGAYGSLVWSAHLAAMYPASTRIVQMADSGVGVISST